MRKITNSKFLILNLCLCTLLVAGCFGRTKAPLHIEQYTFEYDSPADNSLDNTNEPIKIERFSTAQSFNSQGMLYRAQPYKIAAYNFNRWRVTPGDMVTDYLTRDFRSSNAFLAVFSYRDIENTRFIVEGGIEEFLESMEQDNWKAILKVSVSLIDGNRKELAKRLVFQKRYSLEESLKGHSPEEFARGMSANMKKFSEQLLKDIHQSIILSQIR